MRQSIHYRQWLVTALLAEIRASHAGSALGWVWLGLMPLLQVAMYVFLFQIVWQLRVRSDAGTDVDFVWFLISAYLPVWAFQDAMAKASTALVGNAHIIRNTLFPPWLLVAARCLLPYLVLLVLCLPMWLVLHVQGHYHVGAADVVWLAFVLVCQLGMTLGVALTLATLGVLLRDLSNLVPAVLMALVLTSPVLYPLSNVPVLLRDLFWLNPLTAFAEAYHILLLTHTTPGMWHAGGMLAWAAGALLMGRWVYGHVAADLPDLI
jgi:lipopolysaccharide transport system permease protein